MCLLAVAMLAEVVAGDGALLRAAVEVAAVPAAPVAKDSAQARNFDSQQGLAVRLPHWQHGRCAMPPDANAHFLGGS